MKSRDQIVKDAAYYWTMSFILIWTIANERFKSACLTIHLVLQFVLGDQQSIEMPPKKAAASKAVANDKQTKKEPVKKSARVAKNKRELSDDGKWMLKLLYCFDSSKSNLSFCFL